MPIYPSWLNSNDDNASAADGSLFTVAQLSGRAWIAERIARARVHLLEAHAQVVQAAAQTAEAEVDARCRILTAKRRFDREQAGASTTGEDRTGALLDALLGRFDVLGRRLMEQEQRRSLPPANAQTQAAEREDGALEEYFSDRHIQALATKALQRLGSVQPGERDRWWGTWQNEVRKRLPKLTAAEVIERAEKMKRLVE